MECTLVFYESPYRIVALVEDIVAVLGNREVVVARELTKKFEEILRYPAEEMLQHLATATIKGEFTVLVKGNKD